MGEDPGPAPSGPSSEAEAWAAAVVAIDRQGVIIDFDPAAEKLLGYARDQAVGRHVSELLLPVRLRAACDAALRRYHETGEPSLFGTRVRVPVLDRAGRELDVETVLSRSGDGAAEVLVARFRAAVGPAVVPAEMLLRAEFFRALVEHSPQLVTVLDANRYTRYASPGTVALFGADSGPQDLERLAHTEDRARARDAIHLAALGRLTEPAEMRLQDRDGAWRAVSVQARDLRAEPAVTGTAIYVTDATRVRAAERRERIEYARLMTLVESLKLGVLLQDADRRVVLTNSAFVEMFDAGSSEPPAARARADEVVRRGRPIFGDEVTLADGRVLERDYVPITLDGSTLGHLWVFRDVTTQAEVRRTLQERNRILTEVSALKTEFVAVLSHELRTPLTSIATFAEMLDVTPDPAEYRAAVGAIRRGAERMLSLVADLVLLARLESGELTVCGGRVDLAALVRAVDPAGAHKVADGPPVAGDEDLLRELLGTVTGVVAGVSAGMELTAAADRTQWTVRIYARTAEPATTERLLSTRLRHPRYPGEHRTGALALMLARAIAARHGGHLATAVDPASVTITITLPIASF